MIEKKIALMNKDQIKEYLYEMQDYISTQLKYNPASKKDSL